VGKSKRFDEDFEAADFFDSSERDFAVYSEEGIRQVKKSDKHRERRDRRRQVRSQKEDI